MNKIAAVALLFFSCAAAQARGAQMPHVTVNGDEVTMTGCVVATSPGIPSPETLVWTRGQLMLTAVAAAGAQANPIGTTGVSGRVFYWLDDADDLRQHIGQRVEIKGELEDFEEGEITIERDGEFTEIEIDIDGESDEIRVPTAWLGVMPADNEFAIVAREVDVDEIRVLGPCN